MNNQKNKKLSPDELMTNIMAELTRLYGIKMKEINKQRKEKK